MYCFTYQGMSFIELMIAIMISAVIVTLLSAVYLLAHKNYILQASYYEIQETNQAAELLLRKAIASTGYGYRTLLQSKITGDLNTITLRQANSQFDDESHIDTYTYFVTKTKRFNQLGESIYALYLRKNNQAPTELIEGINQMQINYDVKMLGEVITKNAIQANDGNRVVGVNIHLILTTVNSGRLKKESYFYIACK